MAGSGVALRLHEFRDGATTLTPKTSRPGRDVRGLYPGQLGRVHTVHPEDCGGRSQCLHESLPKGQQVNHQQSFDVRTLEALSTLHQCPTVQEQRTLLTTYQEHFSLQAPLFPQGQSTLMGTFHSQNPY